METVFLTIGHIFMGGHIFFLGFIAAYFLLITPRLNPKQNNASRALNVTVGLIMFYQLLTYLLWLIPELQSPEKAEIYRATQGWESYSDALDYLDVLALPIYMLLGHVVTKGQIPPLRFVLPHVLLIGLAIIIDQFFFESDAFFYVIMTIEIIFCIGQFLWYGYCVNTYRKKLLDQCSNIDNRDMGWYLKSQMPAVIVTAFYAPLVGIHEESIYAIIYDVLLMAAHIYIVVAVMLHKVDDNMSQILQSIDYRAEAKAEAEARQAAKQESKAKQPEVAVQAAETTPAEWTRSEQASFDFSTQMAKLETEEFYTDPDVNIDWLADHLGTNRHYVSNYLNQILKMTFYEYVNSLRLQHAERLLRTSNEKASAIGYMSGFNSEGTYRRLFKDRFGCTPTQYIKRAA